MKGGRVDRGATSTMTSLPAPVMVRIDVRVVAYRHSRPGAAFFLSDFGGGDPLQTLQGDPGRVLRGVDQR